MATKTDQSCEWSATVRYISVIHCLPSSWRKKNQSQKGVQCYKEDKPLAERLYDVILYDHCLLQEEIAFHNSTMAQTEGWAGSSFVALFPQFIFIFFLW